MVLDKNVRQILHNLKIIIIFVDENVKLKV